MSDCLDLLGLGKLSGDLQDRWGSSQAAISEMVRLHAQRNNHRDALSAALEMVTKFKDSVANADTADHLKLVNPPMEALAKTPVAPWTLTL